MNYNTLRSTYILQKNKNDKTFKEIAENLNLTENQIKRKFYYKRKAIRCKPGPARIINKKYTDISVKD